MSAVVPLTAYRAADEPHCPARPSKPFEVQSEPLRTGGGSGEDEPAIRFAASGRSRGSTAAWGPPLRRQTRRLEVVGRPLPRSVPALLPRRISGLLRLDLLQDGRQPLVVDDRAGLHGLDLVEHLSLPKEAPIARRPCRKFVAEVNWLTLQSRDPSYLNHSSVLAN